MDADTESEKNERERVLIKKASLAEPDNYWCKVNTTLCTLHQRTKGYRHLCVNEAVKLEFEQQTTGDKTLPLQKGTNYSMK